MCSPSSDHPLEADVEGLEVQALGGALRHLLATVHFVDPSLGQGWHRTEAMGVEMGSTFRWHIRIFLEGTWDALCHSQFQKTRERRAGQHSALVEGSVWLWQLDCPPRSGQAALRLLRAPQATRLLTSPSAACKSVLGLWCWAF